MTKSGGLFFGNILGFKAMAGLWILAIQLSPSRECWPLSLHFTAATRAGSNLHTSRCAYDLTGA